MMSYDQGGGHHSTLDFALKTVKQANENPQPDACYAAYPPNPPPAVCAAVAR